MYMPNYPVRISEEQITVGQFLRQRSLRPRFQNPDTRIPLMLGCQGIVHYTRSGTRTVVSSEDYQMQNGDFLAVADEGSSGEAACFVTGFNASDFAFVIPTDTFGTNARQYMNRRPETVPVTGCNSLNSILNAIVSGSQITTPINDIIIVSHSNVGGFLFFRLFDTSRNAQINYEELNGYINNTERPQITDRVIRNNANIHIRGCNIGWAEPFLRLIKRLFGDAVTVTAPRHVDGFGHFWRGQTSYRYEWMLYYFLLLRKEQVTDRDELISLFYNAGFTDIFGSSIGESNWNSWIPQNINTSSSTRHELTSPLDPEMYIDREFRFLQDNNMYEYGIDDLDSEPDGTGDPDPRIEILRDHLRTEPTMLETHEFPEYRWFGYNSLDDFVDNISWTFNWSNGVLTCNGSRCLYEVRIPITDGDNNLMLNAFLDAGERQYEHHDMLETDTRFFGIVSPTATGSGETSEEEFPG